MFDKKNELMSTIYTAILEYRNSKELDKVKILNERVIAEIIHLLTDTKNPKSIKINHESMQEIEKHASDLVGNVEKKYSRSFFTRWAEKIIRFVQGKKQSEYKENIAIGAKNIKRKLAQLIKDDPANKAAVEKDRLEKFGHLYLAQMKKYDLLDNLVDIKRVKKLNDKDLDTLYRLTVLELGINGIEIGKALNIGKLNDKILEHDKGKKLVSRGEMIGDMEAILLDFKNYNKGKAITAEQLNIIKFGKAERQVIAFEAEIGSAGKKDKDLSKLLEQMTEQKDLYFLKEIACDVVGRVGGQDFPAAIVNIYKKAGSQDPSKALEEDILSQLHEHKAFIVNKLKFADEIKAFKDNLIQQIQGDKIIGHVENAVAAIDPTYKIVPKTGEIQHTRTRGPAQVVR